MAAKKKKPAKKKVAKKAKKKAVKAKKVAKKKKSAKKKTSKPASKTAKQKQDIVGVVTHYFPHVNAAVVKVKKPLIVGDRISITGHTTHLEQNVDSMQIDHVPIQAAKRGDEIGLQVGGRVRDGDIVQKT